MDVINKLTRQYRKYTSLTNLYPKKFYLGKKEFEEFKKNKFAYAHYVRFGKWELNEVEIIPVTLDSYLGVGI